MFGSIFSDFFFLQFFLKCHRVLSSHFEWCVRRGNVGTVDLERNEEHTKKKKKQKLSKWGFLFRGFSVNASDHWVWAHVFRRMIFAHRTDIFVRSPNSKMDRFQRWARRKKMENKKFPPLIPKRVDEFDENKNADDGSMAATWRNGRDSFNLRWPTPTVCGRTVPWRSLRSNRRSTARRAVDGWEPRPRWMKPVDVHWRFSRLKNQWEKRLDEFVLFCFCFFF